MITITTIHAHGDELHAEEHHEEEQPAASAGEHDHDNDGHADHAADAHTETTHQADEAVAAANVDTMQTSLLIGFGLLLLLIAFLAVKELIAKRRATNE